MSDDGRAPCRVALAPVLTTGRECAKTGKSRTGWRAIFHHGIRRLVITGFRRFASQAVRQPKVKKKPEDRNHVGKNARNSQVAGRWAPNLFYFAFAHAMHGSVTSQAAASRPFLYRSPHIAGQNPLL